MSTNNTDDLDEPSLIELEEAKRAQEALGGSVDDIEEEFGERERIQRLLERRAIFAEAAQDASGHVREAYLSEIGEIDEVLAVPLQHKAEQLEAEADELERQAESFDTKDSDAFEGTREKALEKVQNKRERAEALRQQLTDAEPLSDSESEHFESEALQDSDHDITRSDPVDVQEYLDAKDIDVSEYSGAGSDKLDSLRRMKGPQFRDKYRIIKAALNGRGEVGADELESRNSIALNHGI